MTEKRTPINGLWIGMAIIITIAVIIAIYGVATTDLGPKVASPEKVAIQPPSLVTGQPVSVAAFYGLAAGDECGEVPLMVDHRGADDPSYSILPRLEQGDYAIAQSWAGFAIDTTYGCQRARPNEKYLDIVALELKCGPAVIQPTVLKEDGQPFPDILLFLYWPGAEPFPVTVDPPLHQSGVAAFTNSEGNVGWGFGPGSQITPGQGGPFDVWASSGGVIVGSDAFVRDGWFDNHCVFNPIYQLAVRQGQTPPPVGDGYQIVDFDADGNVIGRIQLESDGQPPAGSRYLKLYNGDQELGFIEWESE